ETEQGYVVAIVTIYPDLVKNRIENRAVKTNVTIPAWLKEVAEEQGINFSQLLQTALKERLNLT
ncbi:MAG: type II toxin-antitoxin system CcdA family antitoxin, partial [Firmicutes bacterium]|nr:type II toxin-antitoxin system CcdA family antitoxin [Bacillota bacterium]